MIKKKINNLLFNINSNTIILLFAFVILLVIINVVFCKLYLLKQPHLVDSEGNFLITRISNEFGSFIEKIINGETPYLLWQGEIKLYTGRSLLVPYLLIFLDHISFSNFYVIHLLKNIFFGLTIFFLIRYFDKKYNNYFLICTLFLIYYLPFNILNLFGIEKEEGFLIYLIAILFIILISKFKYKSIFLSIVLILIFFIKATMFFLTLIIPIIYIIIEKKDKFRYLALICIIISNLVLSFNNYKNSGYFSFGFQGSSLNSAIMYTISTKDFNKSYPNIVADVYLYRTKEIIKDLNIKDERTFSKILLQKSIKFIKDEPLNYFYGLSKRLYVLFLNPFKDAQYPYNFNSSLEKFDYKIHKSKNSVRISNIFNKIIFIISLTILIYNFFNKKKNIYVQKINYYYLSILILYLMPYMAAFIYERHAVPIYIISNIYLMLIVANWKKNIFYNKN